MYNFAAEEQNVIGKIGWIILKMGHCLGVCLICYIILKCCMLLTQAWQLETGLVMTNLDVIPRLE